MSEPTIRHLPPRERPSWLPAHVSGYRRYRGQTLVEIVRYDASGPVCAWCNTEIAEGAPWTWVWREDGRLAVYAHQACVRRWRREQKEAA